MTKAFAEKLCCPFDKSELNTEVYLKDENGDVIEGLMTCAECNRYYPIVHGIPIMTPDEYREDWLERPFLEKRGLDVKRDENNQLKLIEGGGQ